MSGCALTGQEYIDYMSDWLAPFVVQEDEFESTKQKVARTLQAFKADVMKDMSTASKLKLLQMRNNKARDLSTT